MKNIRGGQTFCPSCYGHIGHLSACRHKPCLFLLVYGPEAVVLVEITVLSARLVLASKVLEPDSGAYDVESSRNEDASQKRNGKLIRIK